jgi:hypothetical protein
MNAIELAVLARLYAEGASVKIRHHPVRHDEFRNFCVALGQFQKGLRDSESGTDAYWTPLLRTAKRFRFDAMASPMAFSDIGLLDSVSSLRSHYARCGGMYPQVAALVGQLIDRLDLVSSRQDSPLWDAAATVIGAPHSGAVGLVLCEARLTAASQSVLLGVTGLEGVRIINQQQLRHTVWYERILLFGAPFWYRDHVFQAPRSRQIEVFRYSWLSGKGPAKRLFTAPEGEQVPDSQSDASDEARDEVLDAGDVLSPTWLTDLSFVEIATHTEVDSEDDVGRESVRARPFLLEGELVVFLEAEDNATALVLDLDEHEEDRLQRLPVDDIVEGMFLLLRAAGGGDYVVPVADALLGAKRAEVRRMQQEWKDRLRKVVRESSLLDVSVRLLDQGSQKANENNVRHWMWGRSIRPNDRADFDAIMKLVGLDAEKDLYWRAMKTIDMAHLQAGQVIRTALLAQVRSADLSALERLGSLEFDLPGADTGRMIASRVLRVGRETVEISSSRVGKPIEAGGA